jgi:hypothetical protein
MTDEAKVQNWWQTVPGTLTAIAAVITAMAGFLAVLAQTGIIGRTEAPKNANSTPANTSAASSSSSPVSVNSQPDGPKHGLEYFVGVWKNNALNPGITKLLVGLNNKNAVVHVWGKCTPTDCDWGEAQAEAYASRVDSQLQVDTTMLQAIYKPGFKETTLTIRPQAEDKLSIEDVTHFVDKSGRADYSRSDVLERAK